MQFLGRWEGGRFVRLLVLQTQPPPPFPHSNSLLKLIRSSPFSLHPPFQPIPYPLAIAPPYPLPIFSLPPPQALKNFFYYVDELDRIVESRGQETLSKSEFKEVLCHLTGTRGES